MDSSPVECRAESAQKLVREMRALHDRVARLVPELGTKRLAVHFRDDNNDAVEYIFTSSTRYNRLNVRHVNITCDECRREVEGPRYKCLACPDYDLCGACEALGVHHEHALMRITKPLHTKKAREILKTWCDKMREEGGEEGLWSSEEAPEDNVSKRPAQKETPQTESNKRYKSTTASELSEDSNGDEDDLSSDESITQVRSDETDSPNAKLEVKIEPMDVETNKTASFVNTEPEVFLKSVSYGAKEFDPLSTESIKEEIPENSAATPPAQVTASQSHQSAINTATIASVPPVIVTASQCHQSAINPATLSSVPSVLLTSVNLPVASSHKTVSKAVPVFQNIAPKTALIESGSQRACLDSKVKKIEKPVRRTVTCKRVLPSTPPPQSAQAASISGVVPPGAQVINLPHGLTLSQLVLDRATVPAPVSGAPTSTSDSSFVTYSHTKRS